MRHNSINYLMGGPIGNTRRFMPWTQPQRNWAAVAGAAVSVIGAMMAGGGDKGGGYPEQKVLPKTVSGSQVQDYDILFDANAIQNMHDLTNQFKEQADKNDAFFNDIYMPFQESMAQANTQMLPTIEQTSGEALEGISKSLLSTEKLRGVFEHQAQQGLSEGSKTKLDSFYKQTDAIPTTEQRVGEALTAVEGQFSAAGKELTRDFHSRGQTVSQASRRDLAFEKAKAKSAAGGLAAEQSRQELLAAKGAAAGLSLQADQTDAAIKAQGAATLGQMAAQSMQALQAAQSGLLKIDPISGQDSRDKAGEGLSLLASQQYGTRSSTDTLEHTQKGIKNAVSTTGAEGAPGGTVGGVGGSGQGGGYDANGNYVGGAGGDYNAGGDYVGGTAGGGTGASGGINPVSGGILDDSETSRQYSSGLGMGRTVEFYGDYFHVADPKGGYDSGAAGGKITNIQTGEILDFTGNLKEGERTKYDTSKFEKLLRKRAGTKGMRSTAFLNMNPTVHGRYEKTSSGKYRATPRGRGGDSEGGISGDAPGSSSW